MQLQAINPCTAPHLDLGPHAVLPINPHTCTTGPQAAPPINPRTTLRPGPRAACGSIAEEKVCIILEFHQTIMSWSPGPPARVIVHHYHRWVVWYALKTSRLWLPSEAGEEGGKQFLLVVAVCFSPSWSWALLFSKRNELACI